jgi:hypothetical protein
MDSIILCLMRQNVLLGNKTLKYLQTPGTHRLLQNINYS